VHDKSELTTLITTLAHEPNGGIIVMPDAFTDTHRAEIISLAARNSSTGLKVADCYPMGLSRSIIFGARRVTSIAFSEAKSLPICLCRRR
jgi:hypothetical protein